MSQQQYPPQQPGWGGPQQPGYGPPPWQPPPPKKSNAGKIIGFGCLGLVGLFMLIAIVGAIAGSGSDNSSSGSTDVKPAASAPKEEQPAADDNPATEDKPTEEAKKDDKPKKAVVTFKVWGTAPAGALGPLDITYGSDSDTRKGKFENGKFTATLPLNDDAMYYTVMAQLQGSGDINCSITVDGHTEKAHASGGYNICHAQANGGLLGWD
jgi:hypothetical protein